MNKAIPQPQADSVPWWRYKSRYHKFLILGLLSEGSQHTPEELADLLQMPQPFVTKITHSLHASGLIRTADQDARKMEVTSSGRLFLKTLQNDKMKLGQLRPWKVENE
ncbi:MarR family transcriptional regulator [Paenibacillus koleovorans]|uniref:MarR family transcriptional regulator n=1 Tax=Paenibacillus koleovorans TaxID=121608 RepID=UPI000FDAC175|nr:helix-turn-helix domain-containing protein [Paenibacillus koleovorans]